MLCWHSTPMALALPFPLIPPLWGQQWWLVEAEHGLKSPLVTLPQRGVTFMFSVLPGTPSQKREKAGIAGVKKVIFF